MDRNLYSKREWMNFGRTSATTESKRPPKAALQVENLEGRVVMAASFPGQSGNPGAEFGGWLGREGFGPRGPLGPPGAGFHPLASASTLGQDATSVNQAFQTFGDSITADVAALRLTATATGGSTSTGLSTYNSAVESAITTLNSSIGSSLANLTNTGADLTSTIDGYTATLQTEIESAGIGLTDSSNRTVLTLNREIGGYVRTTSVESTRAILSDSPTGSLTGSTVRMANQSVQTALQTFNMAINSAKRTAIAGGTPLDSSTVSAAVATLQTSLDSAISSLRTAFASSTNNPTDSLNSLLSSLTTELTAISAPTTGNYFSARTFVNAINSSLMKAQLQGSPLVTAAISQYNQSLL